MSQIQIAYLIFAGVGVAVALYALFRKSREHEPVAWRDRITGAMDAAEGIVMQRGSDTGGTSAKIEEHWQEIDKTLEEFHSAANTAIAELDDKYQEMMFLYTLIDEKKKEVLELYNTEPKVADKPAVATRPRPATNRSSHPRRKDIVNLSKQGLSISEIAQELNVGQDMVSLILEMGKSR
jgi:predicted transcriptional regulator